MAKEEKKQDESLIQRSLVVLKPDTVQRGIIGEIISRFERVGLKIVGMKMVMPGEELYYQHYEDIGQMITRRGEQAFRYNVKYMMSAIPTGEEPVGRPSTNLWSGRFGVIIRI